MAISKVQLPDGTTQDVHDSRVVSDAIAYVGDASGSATAWKRKVSDKTGTQFFPITHVEAVINDNGTTVASTLSLMDSRITALEGTDFDGEVYSSTEYPEL